MEEKDVYAEICELREKLQQLEELVCTPKKVAKMPEPSWPGSAVIDSNGFTWRLNIAYRWESTAYPNTVTWKDISLPVPYQNCILSEENYSEEPPVGSIIVANYSDVAMRFFDGWKWVGMRDNGYYDWNRIIAKREVRLLESGVNK